jgi:hypothetical protein
VLPKPPRVLVVWLADDPELWPDVVAELLLLLLELPLLRKAELELLEDEPLLPVAHCGSTGAPGTVGVQFTAGPR